MERAATPEIAATLTQNDPLPAMETRSLASRTRRISSSGIPAKNVPFPSRRLPFNKKNRLRSESL